MNKKQKVLIITIVLLGYFIILVDTSLVFTCSKEISQSFQMNTNLSAWISNSYALTFGSLLLLGGKLGDAYGRKKIFMLGLVLFGISSGMVGFAPNAILLIIFRAIQGIGAAIIAPATLAIIMDNFMGQERIAAISIYGTMSGIGVSVGLIIGAGITTILSWRWGFLVNLPIVAILLILTAKFLPTNKFTTEKLDIFGSIISCLALIFIINGISGIGSHAFSIVIGILLLGYFIFYEKRISHPILPLTLFSDKKRNLAYLIRFAYSGAITSFWFFTPLLLQTEFKMTPLIVGVSFLPMTIANFISATMVDYFTKKLGSIKLLFIGLIITTIGFSSLTLFKSGLTYMLFIALPMIIIGLGQGLILSPVTSIAVMNTPQDLTGVSSSVINVMLQIGGAFGLSIVTVLSHTTEDVLAFHYRAVGFSILSIIALLFSGYLLIMILKKKKNVVNKKV